MTFHDLLDRVPVGGVLRARRESWPDPEQCIAVRVLRTHNGGRAMGFMGRLFDEQVEPAVFPTSTVPQGLCDDWTWHLGQRHEADGLGRAA